MPDRIRKSRKGFSLIELVIVVVIIGIIAAIAIPKMSRGAAGAGESALAADLQVLRNALEMYQAEHNGNYPSLQNIVAQLTGLTDVQGNILASSIPGTVAYGPYLKAIPNMPIGGSRGLNVISSSQGPNVGWIYDAETGVINANASGSDGAGTAYINY